MKIIIFILCLLTIIGYKFVTAEDQIPVEIIDTTDSPIENNDSELSSSSEIINKDEKTTTVKPIDITKKSNRLSSGRRISSSSGRNDEKKLNIKTEKIIEKPIEKLETIKTTKTTTTTTTKSPISDDVVINRGSNKFTENVIHSGSNGPDDYSFSFKTEEGHNRDELVHIDRTGKSLNDNEEDLGSVSAKGSYSFISADGFEYTVDYVADGKGYHPKVNVRKI